MPGALQCAEKTLFLFLCLRFVVILCNSRYELPNCNPHLHNHEEVSVNVRYARSVVANSTVPLSDRMAINMIFSHGFAAQPTRQHVDRLPFLKCALKKVYLNLLPHNELDIFVWVPQASIEFVPAWLKNAIEYPRTYVMPIINTTWMVPCGIRDERLWPLRKHFNVDYHIMGRWRITTGFDFIYKMGYKFYMQLDDDAMLNNKIEFNLVQKFREKQYQMGVFSDYIGEVPQVTNGLAELTRYWLTITNYNPTGPLFDHVSPKSLDGVTSKGWDRYYHPTYFLITSIDFWFSDIVQDFLTTVLQSGRDVEGRWGDQVTQNMMRIVFIPKEKVWVMDEMDIGHDRHKKANFENWCTKPGIVSL